MKAKHLLITLIGLFLLVSPHTFAWDDESDSNSASNPYIIDSYETLKFYSNKFKAGNRYTRTEMDKYQFAYYKITANIVISSNDWESIGNSTIPFQGHIEGDNHTITIQVDKSLFGIISQRSGKTNPSIKNLKIITNVASNGIIQKASNCNLNNIRYTGTIRNNSKNAVIGSIVAISNGCSINNCSFTGTIQNYSKNTTIGTIVGQSNNSSISYCNATGTIQNYGKNTTIGGIVAKASHSSISNSINNGSIQQNGTNGYFGGIVAEATNFSINSCTNKGTITGSSNNNSAIGGIAAVVEYSDISKSANEASLTKAYKIGGIVALNIQSNIIESKNKGTLSNAETIGGIVGEVSAGSNNIVAIKDCHNTQKATLSNANTIGGIIGYSNYISMTIESSNKANISTKKIGGGLIGKANNETYLYKSINVGTVTQSNNNSNAVVGGIIGENSDYLWMQYLGNYGNITSIDGISGGIVGYDNNQNSEIAYSVQCSNIRANNTNKIFPISNRGTFSQCYYDKELTSSTTSNGKFTAELKNNSLRYGAYGEGYSDQNWDFTQGYYLVPKPFGHFGNIDPNIGLTPITDAVTVVFMNNNQVYDYQKNQTTIQFPNNPTGFDGYTFIGWSYDASNISLASDNSQIFVEKLNHKTNTELKLFAVWSKDSQWTTSASVKELVIEDQMTLNQDASYGQIIVNPGAVLTIGYGVTIKCDQLTIKGRNLENDQVQGEVKFLDDVSELHITNGWMYARLTNGFNFTYFSLPYDCTKADVYTLESEKAAYGSNWIVKSYNAEKRATSGTGTTNWIYETGPTIEAGVGYIFGTTFDHNQTFYFKPSTKQTILKFNSKMLKVKPTKKQSQKVSDNNWNLCGNFYTSSLNCTPSFATDDHSRAPRHIFISVPDANNNGATFSYLSTMEGNFTIPAFSVFYTQAKTSGKINIDAQQEVGNAPQRAMQVPSAESQIFNDLTFTCINDQTQAKDNMGISLSDQGLLAYEIGFDYEKRVGLQDKPQIYTIADNNKLAYNDIAYSDAVNLPMGLYAPIGNYTLSMNRMEQNGIQSVFLLDNESGMTIDLMTQDYTFQVQTAEETMTRFSITVVQGTATPTDIENTENQDNISITTNEIGFVINNAPLNSRFLVVDASGRMVAQGTTIDVLQTVEINNSGIYMIQVQTPEGQTHTYKTIK